MSVVLAVVVAAAGGAAQLDALRTELLHLLALLTLVVCFIGGSGWALFVAPAERERKRRLATRSPQRRTDQQL